MGTCSLYVCFGVHGVLVFYCLLFEVKYVIMSLGQPPRQNYFAQNFRSFTFFPLTLFHYLVSLFIWSQ